MTATDSPAAPASNDAISGPGRLRALLERLRLAPRTPAEVVYSGFISYSHSADGALAPALQTGLHRFAKPWYRMRALHVFRDEASLSANPELWHSIVTALDGSEYLILLASRAAAESVWCDREVAHWRETKDPRRILVCLTDGELVWNADAGRFDAARTDALPPAAVDAFTEEPRFIDLRWTRGDATLTLRNARWRDAVAEIAAPLHHVPKDVLSGEDVRQHRRTVRVAQAAGAALLALAVVAVVFGLIALSQYHGAEARADAAEATADLQSNPELSLALALKSTQESSSSAGTTALQSALTDAPERVSIRSSAGAAVHATWSPNSDEFAVSTDTSSVQLWNAFGRLERTLPGLSGAGEATSLSYSPDGRWLAAATASGEVEVWNVTTGRAVSTTALNRDLRAANSFKGEGVATPQTSLTWDTGFPGDLIAYGAGIDRVLYVNVTSGVTGTFLTLNGRSPGASALVASPDGSRIFVIVSSGGYILLRATRKAIQLSNRVFATGGFSDNDGCWSGRGSRSFLATWSNDGEAQDENFRIWDGTTARELAVFGLNDTTTAGVCGTADSYDWEARGSESGVLGLHELSDIGPDGTPTPEADLAYEGNNFQVPAYRRFIEALAASPDGAYLAGADDDGTARIFDVLTGTDIRTMNDGSSVTGISFSPDSGLVLTTDSAGMVRIWDTGAGEPVTHLASVSGERTYPLGFVAGDRLVAGLGVADSGSTVPQNSVIAQLAVTRASTLFWSARTGRLVANVTLPDDIRLDTTVSSHLCNYGGNESIPCGMTPPPDLAEQIPTSNQSAYDPGLLGMAVSPGGSEIAYATPTGAAVVDRRGHPVATLMLGQRPTGVGFSSRDLIVLTPEAIYLRPLGPHGRTIRLRQANPPIDAEASANGARLVVGDLDGPVTVYDTATGVRIATFTVPHAFASEVRRLNGASKTFGTPSPTRVAINADGSEIAVGTSWQTVVLWNVNSRREIGARLIGLSVDTGVDAENTLTEGGFNGPWAITQLSFAADGSRLLATDYPAYSTTDSVAPIVGELLTSTGGLVSDYESADVGDGDIDPGDAISPDGQDLLGGAADLGLGSANAADTIYEGSTQASLLSLGVVDQVLGPVEDDYPAPYQPWASNGIDVLAGDAIYPCDACGSVTQMQHEAESRLTWLKPLSAGHDRPPKSDPYG